MSKAEIRKAAVLLLSLPAAEAARLWAGLEPGQVERVTKEIANIKSVTADEQQSVICELADISGPRRSPPAGPFAFLHDVDCHVLVGILVDELPQTIALIASHVPSAYGAAMISLLPAERQLAVIRSVASMEPTEPAIARDVARALAQRLSALVR